MRIWARAAFGIVLAATLAQSGCGGAQSRFAAHMQRGQAYFSRSDFTKASIEFRNALQIQPKNDAARLMAGRAAERLGHPREAFGFYQSVVDSAPQNVEARADLSRLLIYGGAADQALKALEPALARHPDDPLLLTLRAAAREQLGKSSDAVVDAERALQLAPTSEEAIEVRAGLYKRAGDIAGATALVSDAVHRLPASRPLHEALVDLYMVGDKPALAEQQLRVLIGLAPQEPRYRYQLAVFYSRTRRLDDAQRVLEDAVKALPRDDQTKLALVDFISTQRTRAQGEQLLRSFIAAAPDDYDLRLGLAALMQRSGAVKEAIEAYKAVVQGDRRGPQGLIARDRLAAIAWSQGQRDEASRLIDQVLQRSPHDNDALTLRGEMALARSDPAAAISDLRGVLRDAPRAIGIRQLLARAYAVNGQPALAEESLRAAMDTAPADVSVRLQLAQLLKETKRLDQALSLLEETARNAPTDAAVREALARGYLVKRDFSSARAEAESLKTLRPDSAAGSYLAGLAAEGENKPAEAMAEYQHALAVQPRAFDILEALAFLELRQGQGVQAVALVKSAVDRDATDAMALNLLGELYLAQNSAAQATGVLTRATSIAPKWWLPYRNLALARITGHDAAGAVAAYEAGIKAAPVEPRLVSELSLLLEKQGRVDDAIVLCEDWHKRIPQVPGVARTLAMLLVTYRHDQKSLDLARDLSAQFASSSDGNLLDTNGWVHFKRGEYAEALPTLERAAERAPEARQIRYHLGMTELNLGKTERARVDLEAALSGSARFEGSDDARAALAALKGRAG